MELYNPEIILQKLHYLHQNPVYSGFAENAEDWMWSSAGDYPGRRDLLEGVILIEF